MHKCQHEVVAGLVGGRASFNNSIFKIVRSGMRNLYKCVGEFMQHGCTTFLKFSRMLGCGQRTNFKFYKLRFSSERRSIFEISQCKTYID